MMITPSFWYTPRGLKDRLLRLVLLPFSFLYAWFARKRFDLYFPVPLEKPVICVGNLVAGGAGKTPTVMALADLLKDAGYNPHLLTRGFGGRESGPLQVSIGRDTAEDVGDEALLLTQKAPAWVASNRALGAQAAIESGASIVIMDDGFQNPVIYKDVSLIVIDGDVGFGNGAVLPAGPLREPLKAGLARADAIILIGEDKTNAIDRIRAYRDLPILRARLEPDASNPDMKGRTVFAFAGIARPQKFRTTLEAAGAVVAGFGEFPDHYAYDDEDLQGIVQAARAGNAPLVTTAKDAVRLPANLRDQVLVFGVHLVFDDPGSVVPLIARCLQKR